MIKIRKLITDTVNWLRPLYAHFTSYRGTPQEGQIDREYAVVLFRVTFLFAFMGTGSSLLFTTAFSRILSVPIILSLSALLLTYAIMISCAIRWRRNQDHRRFLKNAILLYACLGLVWGILVNFFAEDPLPDEGGNVIGIIMALISTPMLAFPMSVAMAFFVPVAALCTFAVFHSLHSMPATLSLSFLSFLAFALAAFTYSNKTFLDRSIGRFKLEKENQTVRVFLREYEEASTDWLWEVDADGRIQNPSLQMAHNFGEPVSYFEGADVAQGFDRFLPNESERQTLKKRFQCKVAFKDVAITVRHASDVRIVSVTGHPLYNEVGDFTGWRGIGSDITTTRQAQQRVEFLASHDGLTGLLTRRAFVDMLDSFCADETHARFSVLFIDLDNFKSVNDTLGHYVGDCLIETIGSRFRKNLEEHGFGARLGGDEFAILLAKTDPSDAAALAEDIISDFTKDIIIDERSLDIGASIGVALYPRHGRTSETLMRRADLALYRAKDVGKGSVVLFDAELEAAYVDRMRLPVELAAALDEGQLYVDYQPVFEAEAGRLVAVEALVRWLHPTRGRLTAGHFVPTAESGDIIDRLGEYVLRSACRAAMEWSQPLQIGVNLSPKQLRTDSFIGILRNCLQETGLPPGRLALEVTETMFLSSTTEVVQRLKAIRDLGVRIILDDFGTGHSSLTHLNRFEIDGIKIDLSFTHDLMTSSKTRAIVETIARLAQDLNIDLVAEGVENAAQLKWYRSHGIPHVQGFLLGRPEAPEMIERLCVTAAS